MKTIATIQVQLTENQVQALQALAAQRGCSVSDLICQSVNDLIQKAAGVTMAERRRRAIAAAGRYRSGRTDISTEHDRYLADIYAT